MNAWTTALSPREWAALTWIAIALAAGVWHPVIRSSLVGILRSFLQPAILTVLVIAAAWIALCVWAMAARELWTLANLKTTIVWAVSFAFVSIFTIQRTQTDSQFFGRTIRETVSITALLTFLIEAHSFSYPVELVALPCLTVVGAMQVMAQLKHKDQPVERLLSSLMSVVVLGYIGFALYRTVLKPEAFFTLDTARELLIPAMLSAFYLPFLFLLGVWFAYERVFGVLFIPLPDANLRRTAQRRAIRRFGFDVSSLDRWRHVVQIDRPADPVHLERTFAEVRGMKEREAEPPYVATDEGWSPPAAINFLTDYGLGTFGYKRLYEDEWGASSPYFEMGDPAGIWRNNLAYYVSGTSHAATKITLKLNLNSPVEGQAADEQFIVVALALIEVALGPGTVERMKGRVAAFEPVSMTLPNGSIELTKGDGITPVPDSYSRKLVISRA